MINNISIERSKASALTVGNHLTTYRDNHQFPKTNIPAVKHRSRDHESMHTSRYTFKPPKEIFKVPKIRPPTRSEPLVSPSSNWHSTTYNLSKKFPKPQGKNIMHNRQRRTAPYLQCRAVPYPSWYHANIPKDEGKTADESVLSTSYAATYRSHVLALSDFVCCINLVGFLHNALCKWENHGSISGFMKNAFLRHLAWLFLTSTTFPFPRQNKMKQNRTFSPSQFQRNDVILIHILKSDLSLQPPR